MSFTHIELPVRRLSADIERTIASVDFSSPTFVTTPKPTKHVCAKGNATIQISFGLFVKYAPASFLDNIPDDLRISSVTLYSI